MIGWLKKKAVDYVFDKFLNVDTLAECSARVATEMLCRIPESRAENAENIVECAYMIAAAAKDKNITPEEIKAVCDGIARRFTDYGGFGDALARAKELVKEKI